MRRKGEPHPYDARDVCGTGLTDRVGGRDGEAAARLAVAFAGSGFAPIRSLCRRPPDESDATRWLAVGGRRLYTAALDW